MQTPEHPPADDAAAQEFVRRAHARDELNAFIGLDEFVRLPGVLDHAPSGPLHGLSYAAKDIIDVAGAPTSGGTSALLRHPAAADAAVVTRLREAGAMLVAKTNLHELSFGITSNNAVHGPVRNPYDPSRIAGGSSGGSAAAVAAGLVPFALAADTGGSARLPAALCGIVGFRPTVGRYPMSGVLPISPTRDTIGLFAGEVELVRRVDAVLAADDATATAGTSAVPASASAVRASPSALDGRRFGLPSELDELHLDPDVAARYREVIDRLPEHGVEVVPIELGDAFDRVARLGLVIALAEFPTAVEHYLRAAGEPVTMEELGASIGSPDVARIWRAAVEEPIPPQLARDALAERDTMRREFVKHLDAARLDAVLLPTAPITARELGEDDTIILRGEVHGTFDTYTRFANLAGVLGLPAISLPAGLDQAGLPIGLELDARPGDDVRLLELAAELARLLPATPRPAAGGDAR
ncbi:amidase family protein [Agromyces sp. NPDC060279]|uniref:amidase family protein n=1 Tax=Agromyces sp. NPDC060279 TaxID=3347092 RepID=UPI00364FE1A0